MKILSFNFCHIFLVAAFLSSNLTDVEGFGSLIQLPHSGSNRTRLRSKRVLYVDEFGAKGDGFSDDTEAFKDAWEVACSLSSQAKIIVPARSTFLVHPIDFSGPCRSKVTLRVCHQVIITLMLLKRSISILM